MLSNRELEIILRLRDEATKKMNEIQGNILKFANELKKSGNALRNMAREFQQIGNAMGVLGLTITGPLLLAFRNAEKYSIPVSNEIIRMKNAALGFQVSLANSLIPIMHKFTNILGSLLAQWNALPKALRDSIVQHVFLTGAVLLLGKAFFSLGSNVLKLLGNIKLLAGSFLMFARLHPYILAIELAMMALIFVFLKFKEVAVPVLNAVEIGARMVAIGIYEVTKNISTALSEQIGFVSSIYQKIADFKMLPENMRIGYQIAANSLQDMSNKLRGAAAISDQYINNLRKGIEDIFVNGKGSLAEGYDKVKELIDYYQNLAKNPPEMNIADMVEKFNALKEIASQTGKSISSSLGEFINPLSYRLKTAQQMFADFGTQVIQILTSVAARLILINSIGRISLGGSIGSLAQYFHSGGVVRAHSGYLARDEVPIIAQTGERILSRSQNREYERGNDQGGNQITIQPIITISAWNTSDIIRNRKEIEGIFINAMRNVPSVREAMKRYG